MLNYADARQVMLCTFLLVVRCEEAVQRVLGLWGICRERYGQELCHSAVRQLWLEQSQSNRAKHNAIVARRYWEQEELK